jgi:outer membrane receptor for ferrienterochelin and colicin
MMTNNWGTMFAVVAYCLIVPPEAWAEPSLIIPRASTATEKKLREETLYLKEETVSVASRYEQPISKAPSDVYVITDEDIRNSGATDIPTLLRQVPGMEVMQTNAADFNVSVRGNNQLRANKLLVMIDGRSIYIDQSGTIQWKLLSVTLVEIKRIEVLKGPASAVYGFNAFDGVVNIITKSPEEMRGITLQVAGGELGTVLTNVVQAGAAGNWGYRVVGTHEQTQRWSDPTTQALNNQRMSVVTEYHLQDNGKMRAEAGIGRANPYNGPVNETNISETQHSLAHARVSYEQNGLLVRGWWNGRSSEGTFHIFPPLVPLLKQTDRFGQKDQQLSQNTYDFETRYRLNPLETLTLNVGANFRHIISSSNFLSTSTAENRLGLYAQGDWTVFSSLEVSAGLRYDLDTFITPTLSPRGAVIYHVNPNHAVRFSSSIAYRPPTVSEAGLSILNPLTLPGSPPINTVVLGSTDVKPEQIISYELGYQGWWLNHRVRTRVTGFFNHISDLIAFRNPTSNPLNPVRPFNGGVADVYGGGDRSRIFGYLLALWICELCVSGNWAIFYWVQPPGLSPSQGQCRTPHQISSLQRRSPVPPCRPGLLPFIRRVYKPGSVLSTRDRCSARTSPRL